MSYFETYFGGFGPPIAHQSITTTIFSSHNNNLNAIHFNWLRFTSFLFILLNKVSDLFICCKTWCTAFSLKDIFSSIQLPFPLICLEFMYFYIIFLLLYSYIEFRIRKDLSFNAILVCRSTHRKAFKISSVIDSNKHFSTDLFIKHIFYRKESEFHHWVVSGNKYYH